MLYFYTPRPQSQVLEPPVEVEEVAKLNVEVLHRDRLKYFVVGNDYRISELCPVEYIPGLGQLRCNASFSISNINIVYTTHRQ